MRESGFRESFAGPIARLALAAAVGAVSAAVVAGFTHTLEIIVSGLARTGPAALSLLPAAGALLCGALILRQVPEAGGEGIPGYLIGVNRRNGFFNASATLLKIPATLITLGFGGSGGIVGPLVRINAGMGGLIVRLLPAGARRHGGDMMRMAALCGASGSVSSIFHSPLGGGIFAAEILRRESMRYGDLFPSIIAGLSSVAVSRFILGRDAVFSVDAPAVDLAPGLLPWIAATALGAGFFGMLFIFVFGRVSRLVSGTGLRQPFAALAGGALVVLIGLSGARAVLGTSFPLWEALAAGDASGIAGPNASGIAAAAVFLLLIIAKMTATACTVGSGLSGGFTGPLVIIGVASGALFSSLHGAPIGSPEYYCFAATGLAAILGGAMNVPLAAAVITISLFGRHYAIPAVAGAVLSFIVYRSRTLFAYHVLDYLDRSDRET